MPKSFTMDNLAFSIRLQPITAPWLEEQAKKIGSFNQAVRNVLDDARTLYGLPEVMTEQLDAEATALGKSRRDCVAHVLSLRAAQLLKGEIALPKVPRQRSTEVTQMPVIKAAGYPLSFKRGLP